MKRNIRAALCLLTAIPLLACSGGGGGGGEGGGGDGTKVTITGEFASATRAPGVAAPLDAPEITGAVAVYAGGGYELAAVSGGKFSLSVSRGEPVGILFIGSSNAFVGYLKFPQGLDALPLQLLPDGVAAFDLGEITPDGIAYTTSLSLALDDLGLSETEIDGLGRMDDLFAALLNSGDSDGNGVTDVLEDKFFRLFNIYFLTGGTLNAPSESTITANLSSAPSIDAFRMSMDVMLDELPEYITITGPEGSGLSNAATDQANIYDGYATYFGPPLSDPTVPPAGAYSVHIPTDEPLDLDFTLPDQSQTTSVMPIIVPTIHLNPNGTMNSVDWSLNLLSGAGGELDPASLMKSVSIQISGNGTPCASYPQEARIYNADELDPTLGQHTLACQNLLWSDVTRVHTAYNDYFGNNIVLTWEKPQ